MDKCRLVPLIAPPQRPLDTPGCFPTDDTETAGHFGAPVGRRRAGDVAVVVTTTGGPSLRRRARAPLMQIGLKASFSLSVTL